MFKEEWALEMHKDCFQSLQTWMPPIFCKEFNVYMHSFFELACCTDIAIRETIRNYLWASAKEIKPNIFNFPYDAEVVLYTFKTLFDQFGVEFNAAPPRNEALNKQIQFDVYQGSNEEEASCAANKKNAKSPLNLWDPSGPKGLNAMEKKRTKLILLRVSLGLSCSDDEEEDDKEEEEKETNLPDEGIRQGEMNMDSDSEWVAFCKEFEDLDKKQARTG